MEANDLDSVNRAVGPFLAAELGEIMYEWHQEEYYSDSPSPAAFVPPAAPPREGRQQRAAHQQPAQPAPATGGAQPAKGQVILIRGEGKRKASPAPQPAHNHQLFSSGSDTSQPAAAASAPPTTAAAAQHQSIDDASSTRVAESVAGGSWVGRKLGPYTVLYDPEIAPHCGYACVLHLAGKSINMAHVRSLRSHVYSVLSQAAQSAALIEGRSVQEWAEIYEEDVDTFVATTLQSRAVNLLDLHVLASSMQLKIKLVRFDGEELAQVGKPQDPPTGVICLYQSHFVVVAEQPPASALEHTAAQRTEQHHDTDSEDNMVVIALVNQDAAADS
eukprot:6480440-Amphidinium_carterae.1